MRRKAVWVALHLMVFFACVAAPAAKQTDDPADGVPYLFGRTMRDADKLARDAGLLPRFVGPDTPGSAVIGQSIKAGRPFEKGATLTLRMGRSGPQVTVPRLTGLSRSDAEREAVSSNLKPMIYGPDDAGMVVLTQSIAAGQQTAKDSYVQLQMGNASARIPRFVGLDIAAARALAAANRLRIQFDGSPVDGAHIVRQSPSAGAPAVAGATETLGVETSSSLRTPNFLRKTRSAAQAIADKAGLVLDVSGDDEPQAHVIRQSPSPGKPIDPAAHVEIAMRAPAMPADVAAPSDTATDTANTLSADTMPASAPVIAPVGAPRSQTPAATISIPDLLGATRTAATTVLEGRGLVADFDGDTEPAAQVATQSPAAGRPAERGDTVRLVMHARKSGTRVIPVLIGLLVAASGAFGVWRFFAKPNPKGSTARTEPSDPVVVPTVDTSPKIDRTQTLAVVNFATTLDLGRPTVRLVGEPPVAGRALTPAPMEPTNR